MAKKSSSRWTLNWRKPANRNAVVVKPAIRSAPAVSACTLAYRFAWLFALLLLSGYSIAQPIQHSALQQEQALQMRKLNRERLMAKAKQTLTKRRAASSFATAPTQLAAGAQLAERAKNRQMLLLSMNLRASGNSAADNPLDYQRAEPMTVGRHKLVAKLHIVLRRLFTQLGKPYVWGGDNPKEGFDCSGLVFYAFNHVLTRKLPRTANAMYQARYLERVQADKLRRGDLVFFNTNPSPGADHVGVYLGHGDFIEAPRSGLTIRINKITNQFWQAHYLGARRILTEDAVF